MPVDEVQEALCGLSSLHASESVFLVSLSVLVSLAALEFEPSEECATWEDPHSQILSLLSLACLACSVRVLLPVEDHAWLEVLVALEDLRPWDQGLGHLPRIGVQHSSGDAPRSSNCLP